MRRGFNFLTHQGARETRARRAPADHRAHPFDAVRTAPALDGSRDRLAKFRNFASSQVEHLVINQVLEDPGIRRPTRSCVWRGESPLYCLGSRFPLNGSSSESDRRSTLLRIAQPYHYILEVKALHLAQCGGQRADEPSAYSNTEPHKHPAIFESSFDMKPSILPHEL